METSEDREMSVVDPQEHTYTDNLNDKNLNTQYIYTTDGQLIPAPQETVSEKSTLDTQFNTVPITEAQSIQVEEVDYQYEQQYASSTAPQVSQNDVQFVQDQTTYVIDETVYVAENQQEEIQPVEQQVLENQIESESDPSISDLGLKTKVEKSLVAPSSVETEPQYVESYDKATNNIETDKPSGETNEPITDTEHEEPEIQKIDAQMTEAVEILPQNPVELQNNTETVEKNTKEGFKEVINLEEIIMENVIENQAKSVEESSQSAFSKDEIILEKIAKVQGEVESTEDPFTVISPEPKSTEDQQNEVPKDKPLEDNEEIEHILTGDLKNIEGDIEPDASVLAQEKCEAAEPSNVQESEETALVENVEINLEGDSQEAQEETMVIVYEDCSPQDALSEEDQMQEEETRDEEVPQNKVLQTNETYHTPRPRGRRPKTDIPLHILGHNVNKPVDSIVNGNTPKPRLGVKVPYRNLTSQIVSKEEIEREIIERGRKKQEQEVCFARQLTARLAKKLAPSGISVGVSKQGKSNIKKNKQDSQSSQVIQELEESNPETSNKQTEVDSNANEETSQTESQKGGIENNSDLLAILEGDGDPEEIIPPNEPESQKESVPTDETNLKNLEREIALQQLQDLPYLSPSTRFVKGRLCKELPHLTVSSDEKSVSPQNVKASVSNQIKNNPANQKTITKATVTKQVQEKKPTDVELKTVTKAAALKQSPDKRHMDVEPQIKVNMTLKTYSRKRKSSDNVTEPLPPKKPPVVVNTAHIDLKPNAQTSPSGDVYVTKSSRIIKKKVIWDPDEVPVRTMLTKTATIKLESPNQPKSNQSKQENKSTDSPKKLTEKSIDKKLDIKVEKKDEKSILKRSSQNSTNGEKRVSPASKLATKPKKQRTEVDKLLGDEGAIKMLYDLKTSEEPIEEKRRKTVFSVEKTFKDLAKKANQIKSDLVNTTSTESPKSLRKKEATVSPVIQTKPLPPPLPVANSTPSVISRQKSKDSNRSTPPRSPTFSFPNETSYLIRRRSSSSLSSGGDTGESVELEGEQERILRKKSSSTPSNDSTKLKKSKKTAEKDQENENESDFKSQKRAENRIGHYQTFNIKKMNKHVTIDLHTEDNKTCYFSLELLEELTTALTKISKEKDCNVVLIRSSKEKTFSFGLDYKALVSDKEIERKNKASELSNVVSDFLKCLLHFPKILIAGIQGECFGLAVTMLPLFDIVIASDTASFSTSYSTLGTIAEAGFLLTVPHVASHSLASELFYISQKLTADEAFRKGLISRLCWPEKYQETLKQTVASISKGSKQSLESTKSQVRSHVIQSTEEAIESMKKQLVEHWVSAECQKNFAKI